MTCRATYTSSELFRIATDRNAIENMFHWNDGATTWEIPNLLEAISDGQPDGVDPDEEFDIWTDGLSSDGEAALRAETYWIANKRTGEIQESDMYELCVRFLDIDPADFIDDTIPGWINQIDEAIMNALMHDERWIEFRTFEDAQEWVAENITKEA